MASSFPFYFSFFRPEGEDLSPQETERILIYRVMGVLGTVLIPPFGYLFKFATPGAVDPWPIRLGIAGLYAGLLVASYVSKWVRRNYVTWMQKLFYVVMAWVVLVTALNHFANNYAVLLLVTYALLAAAVGIGAQTIWSVISFLSSGLIFTAGAVLFSPTSDISSAVLLGSMVLMALVGGILIQGYFSARETIHDQKERLRTITENVSDGIYRSVPGEGLVYANQGFAEMFGHESVEEVLGEDPSALYASAEERERLQKKAEEHGHLAGAEVQFQRQDGTVFTGLLNDTVVYDEDGAPTYYDGVIHDITEQKQRQRQVERLRKKYQGLLEGAPDAIFVADAETGEIVETTAAAASLLDTTEEEIVGRDQLELHPAEQREKYRALFERHKQMEGTEAAFSTLEDGSQIYVVTDSERRVPVEINATRVELGSRNLFMRIFRDITDRKEREQKLRSAKEEAEEARELFEMILNNVPVMIDFFDTEGNLQMVNKHWEEVLGWSEEEIKELSDPTTVLYTDPDERRESLGFMAESPNEWRDFQLKTKDGEVLDTTWTNVELSDGRRIGIGLDITPRKERERQLRAAKDKAEEAARLKSAMLANMSHEVRTPLTSMIGYADLLRTELTGEPAEMVEHIYESGQRLYETLDAVLRLSRLESGAYELNCKPVCVNALVRDVAQEFRAQAHEKGIKFDVDGPEEEVEAHWDETATRRIITNLLENALKFTPEGGRVQARVYLEEETIVLEVEDTGVGIAEGTLPKMFEAFTQESEGFNRKYEGSGLGLSVVQRLIELMEGTIDIESEKTVGTHVAVRLPRRIDREATVTMGSNGNVGVLIGEGRHQA